MQSKPFEHFCHAHCESGVASNLLAHYGIPITEPLAFGIGAGLFFLHLPFLKVDGVPGTSYRSYPGLIFKTLMKSLGVSYEMQKFGTNKIAAKAELDQLLDQGIPVGMITSVYYLDYLPEIFRFHFNAHNLLVIGRENDKYLISDPILDTVQTIDYSSLEKARFAKGALAPKGKMYHITNTPASIDLEQAIRKGIRKNTWLYLSPPVPYFGNNGIHYLAKKIETYPDKLTPRKASLYLGNIIRMQEEIGTGGGGFRFLYAAFLQQAADIIHVPALKELSERMTIIGDDWRAFAVDAARICKDRSKGTLSYKDLSNHLHKLSDAEKVLFIDLKKMKI